MAHNESLVDDKFATILADVVWRFYVYDQYGKKQDKAFLALAKRSPCFSADFFREMFDLNLKIMVATIEAFTDAP